jgi:Ca2+-binding EF-hand superfamily protein
MQRLAFALVGLALGSAAYALEFGEADMDGNGMLSPDEFAVMYPTADGSAFGAVDADEDGAVSEKELLAAIEAGAFTVTN